MRIRKLSVIMTLILIFFGTACSKAPKQEETAATELEIEKAWKMETFAARKAAEEEPLYVVDYEKVEKDELPTGTEQWGIAGGSILDREWIDSQGYLYWVSVANRDPKNWEILNVYAVYTDADNNKLESYDITGFFKERGYLKENTYVLDALDSDAAGNTYVSDIEQNKVYMLSKEGIMLKQYTFPSTSEYHSLFSFLTEQGERVFVHQCENGSRFVWLGGEASEMQELAVDKELQTVQKWYGIKEDVLYYAIDDQLVGWNVKNGEEKRFFGYQENGINDVMRTSLLLTEEELKLLVTEKNKQYALTLSTSPKEIESKLQVANACSENSFLKGRTVTFSRENPEYAIEYVDSYASEEDIQQVLLEVANGKGPDVIYIPGEELRDLQESDALADLTQLLSKENLEVLYPGAIAMGTCNEELVGLPLSFYIRTLLTNKEYWKEATWTVKDILQILDEQPNLQGIFTDLFGQDNYFYNLYFAIGIDTEHSAYLADGVAGFQEESFKKLLRYVKEKTNNTVLDNPYAALQAGEYLGIQTNIYDLNTYASVCNKVEDKGCVVGYPTDAGAGNFMYSQGMLVVNQKSMEKQGVSELVNYLFSLESHQMIEDEISVRQDALEGRIFFDNEKYYLKQAGGTLVQLKVKEDGSTYYNEYQEFFMSAVPYISSQEEIFNMVYEEAESYFNTDKELEKVVDIIQNRVQLYLDERQ